MADIIVGKDRQATKVHMSPDGPEGGGSLKLTHVVHPFTTSTSLTAAVFLDSVEYPYPVAPFGLQRTGTTSLDTKSAARLMHARTSFSWQPMSA